MSDKLVKLTQGDIQAAGVVDFKITKDDFIDVFCEEAREKLEARLGELQASCSDHYVMSQALIDHISKLPEVRPFAQVYKKLHKTCSMKIENSGLPQQVLVFVWGGTNTDRRVLSVNATSVTINTPEMYLKEVEAWREKYHATMEELNKIESALYDMDNAPKRFKAKMVRQLIKDNPNGANVLKQLTNMSDQIVAAALGK